MDIRISTYSAFLTNALGAKKTVDGTRLTEGAFPTSNPLIGNSNVSLWGNKFNKDTTNPLELNILRIQKEADINGNGETTDVEVHQYLLQKADTDKDGRVSGDEYSAYLEKAMDADKDGIVSKEERVFFDTLIMDTDGDGLISRDEALSYVINSHRAEIADIKAKKSSRIPPTTSATSAATSGPISETSEVSVNDSTNLDPTKAGTALNKLLDKNGKGGALEGKGELIAQIAKEYDIPVNIFAAIIFAETGWGKSNAIKNYNNPGGIMDKSTGCRTIKRFSSLEEGLRAMASNLKRNYFDKGLDTLAKIQPKYCPIGAANDPKGLNKNWLPTVTKISNQIASMC